MSTVNGTGQGPQVEQPTIGATADAGQTYTESLMGVAESFIGAVTSFPSDVSEAFTSLLGNVNYGGAKALNEYVNSAVSDCVGRVQTRLVDNPIVNPIESLAGGAYAKLSDGIACATDFTSERLGEAKSNWMPFAVVLGGSAAAYKSITSASKDVKSGNGMQAVAKTAMGLGFAAIACLVAKDAPVVSAVGDYVNSYMG